jgi:hypothetical protein
LTFAGLTVFSCFSSSCANDFFPGFGNGTGHIDATLVSTLNLLARSWCSLDPCDWHDAKAQVGW